MSRWLTLVFVAAACRPSAVAEPPAEPIAAPPSEPAPAEPGEPAEAPVAETPPPGAPASYELDGNRLILPGPVNFAAGLDAPGRGSEAALEHIRGYLDAKEYVTQVRIEGHVAGVPDAQALSERRALAVARWLVSKGVDCKRLVPVGFGDSKPVADGSTPEGRAQNTRIDVHNVALRGRLIGGMPADGGGRVAGDPCT